MEMGTGMGMGMGMGMEMGMDDNLARYNPYHRLRPSSRGGAEMSVTAMQFADSDRLVVVGILRGDVDVFRCETGECVAHVTNHG